MLAEKILGKLNPSTEKEVDYVEIEWDEAFKKIHKKITVNGKVLGIRLDNEVLTRGLRQDDVLYEDKKLVIAVRIPACTAMEITVDENHPQMAAKVCYEIGNTHGALFWGEKPLQFLTPLNGPLQEKLQQLHGVTVCQKEVVFDFERKISSSVNGHHH